MRICAAFCAIALAAATTSSAQPASVHFDVFVLAVGSSDYVSPPAGYHGFGRLDGANKSARLVADAFAAAGARRAIVLTSASSKYVSAKDVADAVRRLKAAATAEPARNALLVFYFAGHGVSEGLGWNQFLIPGDFVYRKDPKQLTVNDLQAPTISAGTLVDALESTGLPYAVILDTCTTGKAQEFDSAVLTGNARASLGAGQAMIRALNEFRDPNPVLFSAVPGSDVPLARDPRDPTSVLSVGPLGRRILIALDRRARSHQDLSLGAFVSELTDGRFDKATGPAVTRAELRSNAASAIAFDGGHGAIEARTGSSGSAQTCCGASASFDGYAAPAPASGQLSYSGPQGEYLSQGRHMEVSSQTAKFRISNDPVHGVNVTVELPTPGDSYTFGISGPDRSPIRVGSYAAAQRHLFQDPGHPGLNFSVPERGCSEVRGSFTVRNITYDAAGMVTALAAVFTQYCDTNPAPLRGSIEVRKTH